MKEFIYQFEKLEVWQLAMELTKDTYKIVSKFPSDEKYNLNSQLKRAAISIGSNIAEGSGRSSKMDRAHFINISFSSALECMSLMVTAHELGFVDEETRELYRLSINQLTNKLNTYYKYQLKKGENLKNR